MIGITIGVGAEWKLAAAASARRMAQTTGLRCVIIDSCPETIVHPSWLKGHIIGMFPEHSEFMVFDADILPLKRWEPERLFEQMGRSFCGVPDRNWAATQRECIQHNFPWPDWYLNGGLLMFGKEHAPVWEWVMRRHPKFGSWLEQTAINKALMELGTEVTRLPRCFNRLYPGSSLVSRSQAINLHLTGTTPQYVCSALKRLEQSEEPHGTEPGDIETDITGDAQRTAVVPAT